MNGVPEIDHGHGHGSRTAAYHLDAPIYLLHYLDGRRVANRVVGNCGLDQQSEVGIDRDLEEFQRRVDWATRAFADQEVDAK